MATQADLNDHELGLNMLLAECRKKGIAVEFVDDDVLHDYIGMNSEAAKAMGFEMPENTIYVDKNLHDVNKYETLRHEMVEMDLMKNGKRYWPSHLIALKEEPELPRKLMKMKKRKKVHGKPRVGLVGMMFGR